MVKFTQRECVVCAGVLMARWKCGSGRGGEAGGACAAHVSRLAAGALLRAGAPHHCYRVLSALLPYWKDKTSSQYITLLNTTYESSSAY
jgi:hypothetical protein